MRFYKNIWFEVHNKCTLNASFPTGSAVHKFLDAVLWTGKSWEWEGNLKRVRQTTINKTEWPGLWLMTCSITAFTATEKTLLYCLASLKQRSSGAREHLEHLLCVSYELYAFIKHDLNYNIIVHTFNKMCLKSFCNLIRHNILFYIYQY